jgi:hypothetical protein
MQPSDERQTHPLDYAGRRIVPRWPVLVCVSLLVSMLMGFLGMRWLNAREQRQKQASSQRQTVRQPRWDSDLHGNVALIDEDRDAVSIAATEDISPAFTASASADRMLVRLGSKTVSVARGSQTLTIALPDGATQQFPLPARFANRLIQRFDRTKDSLLRDTVALYPAGENRSRLEDFVARHTEPSVLKRPATSTSRPAF